MNTVDLTAEQIEQLFSRLDATRRYFERLHDRILSTGFTDTDPLRIATARTLKELRGLVLTVNDQRRKGKCRAFQRRAKAWKGL